MPVYNAEAFLKDSMDSILSQTFTDFELLALDDGSTDRSAEIINSYDDPRIHYILCPHDFISTLNHGIEIAQGEYIARMDADDIMMPERLQLQYEYMEQHPETAVCGSALRRFGTKKEEVYCVNEHDDIVNLSVKFNPVAHPTTIIRRSVLIKYNIRYRKEFILAEDFKMWVEIIQKGQQLHNLPKILLRYRCTEGQISSINYAKQQSVTLLVQYEMVNYLLSCIDPDCPIKAELDGFLKQFEEFNEQCFFSKDVYFGFMYEFILGLRNNGYITLKTVE